MTPLPKTFALGAALAFAGCSHPAEVARREPDHDSRNLESNGPNPSLGAQDATTTPEPSTTVTSAPPERPTTTLEVLPVPTTARSILPEYDGPYGDMEWLIRSTFPEDPDTAARIGWCESRFKPDAGFPNGPSLGLMQIHWASHAARVARMGYTRADLANPFVNLLVARAIYDESGWAPWDCA